MGNLLRSQNNNNKKPLVPLILTGAVVFIICFYLCVFIGSVKISFFNTLRILINSFGIGDISDINSGTVDIIRKIRIPRALVAALCGASLSGAGAAMQGMLRNPLADGSTLGVASGGTLGAVIVLGLGLFPAAWGDFTLPAVSMLFSFGFLLLILFVSYRLDKNLSGLTIILCGVIFSMLASGLISLIIALSGDKLDRIFFWTLGSFAGKDYKTFLILFVCCTFGILILLRFSGELNILSLGEEQAAFLGVNTKSVKLWIIAACAVLIGSTVAFSGAVGFVGLAVPHITRFFTGPDHKRLLPVNIFIGAIFMMLADMIARTVISPSELPVGVITQIAGSVIFIVIFIARKKKAAQYD